MKRPMIVCAVACIALSLCVLYLSATMVGALAVLSFALLAVLCFFKKTQQFVIIVAIVFLFLFNTTHIKVRYIDKLKMFKGEELRINAVVTEVEHKENYFLLNVKVKDSDGRLPDNTKLRLTNYTDGVSVGNEITADIKISGIDDSVYKKSNYSSGIFATGYIQSIVQKEYGKNIYHSLANFKTMVSNILFSNMSYSYAAFGSALTVGDKEYIDDDLYNDVKSSGVSHVIAVSGLHMAIICGSIHKLLNRFKFNRQISAIMTILFMVFFMALCGFSASVLRAGLMYGIFLFSRIFLKKRDGLNSLSIAVTIMLIINPFLIWNVGFLLSASATFGIIVILPIIEDVIDRRVENKILNPLLKASSVTLSALITTTPISVYYYETISLVSIFTNICISFAVSVLLILMVTGIGFGFITGNNFLVSMLFNGSEIVSAYVVSVIRFFGKLPFANIACSVWAITVVYILVIAILLILKYTNIMRLKKRSV